MIKNYTTKMKGIVSYHAGLYFVNKTLIDKTRLYMLPGDEIEYDIMNDKAIVHRISHRTPLTTVAIVEHMYRARSPLIPDTFVIHLPNVYPVGQRLKVRITLHGCTVLNVYDMNERINDQIILSDLYNEQLDTYPADGIVVPSQIPPPIDQTSLNTFTIDPKQSADFDDAISIDLLDRKIFVHIVDLHRLLPMGSTEDRSAYAHGFTLYMQNTVVNLLPPPQSEDAFSLIKGVPRHVLTLEFCVNEDNQIASTNVYPSIIIVKERYDYDSVRTKFVTDDAFVWAMEVTKNYMKPGFTLPTLSFVIVDNAVQTVGKKYTHEVHKFIETWMILANHHIATHLEAVPQRYHPESITSSEPIPSDWLSQIMALKGLHSATYEAEKKGHSMLNLPSYTHFTSPIRRYADLIVHRMWYGTKYDPETLTRMLAHLTRREKWVSKLSELDARWRLLSYLETQIHHRHFTARVIKAMKPGIVAVLEDFLIDAYIHVSRLGRGFWSFESEFCHLRNGSSIVERGSKVEIRIDNIDWIKTGLQCSVVSILPVEASMCAENTSEAVP